MSGVSGFAGGALAQHAVAAGAALEVDLPRLVELGLRRWPGPGVGGFGTWARRPATTGRRGSDLGVGVSLVWGLHAQRGGHQGQYRSDFEQLHGGSFL